MKRALAAFVLLVACSGSPTRPAATPAASPTEALLEPRAVLAAMTAVADGQLARTAAEADWKRAAFLLALLDLAELAGDGRALGAIRAFGEASDWKMDPALARAQPFLALYQRDRDRRTIGPTLAALDRLCAGPELATGGSQLARARPHADLLPAAVLAAATSATGQQRFRQCAERWLTQLAVAQRGEGATAPAEGADQAWSLVDRLALLQHLPVTHPSRPAVVRELQQGAARLLRGQRPDGSWGDPVATALGVHLLAAGVNRGLLERAGHEPPARRGWIALAGAGRPAGLEGAAASLLAGAEVFRLALFEDSRAVVVELTNPLAEARLVETAEIPWPSLAQALGAVPGDPIVALDERSGRLLPSQLLDENGDALAERLLVSVSLLGSESRRVVVRRLARPFRAPAPAGRAYGRYVPRPHEDFAWENDRVAFRVFASGIDVWAKRIREPVIDRWYQRTDRHRDQGEGADLYHVGPSRGCGGLGLWDGTRLHTSRTFASWRLIADGPVRVAFQLDYPAWGPPDARVTETKRVTLDLGQNLSRLESRFSVSGSARPLPVAVGVLRRGEGTVARDEPTTWLSYVEPPQGPGGERGQIGCGVVGDETVRFVESDQHYLMVRDHDSQRPFVYYAGAYWSKAADFRQPDEWAVHLAAFSRRAGAPLSVAVLGPPPR